MAAVQLVETTGTHSKVRLTAPCGCWKDGRMWSTSPCTIKDWGLGNGSAATAHLQRLFKPRSVPAPRTAN